MTTEAEETLSTTLDLDDLVHLETMFEQLGRDEGVLAGRSAGTLQGRLLGRERAFTALQEVGYYQGVIIVLLGLLNNKEITNRATSRAIAQVQGLMEMIETFPLENRVIHDTEEESKHEDAATLLGRIRAKFKVICAVLGLKTAPGTRGAVVLTTDAGTDKPERLDY